MVGEITRDEINAFGEAIKALMLDGDSAVLVQIGAAAPSPDCRIPSALATVSGLVGRSDEAFTGNAVNLDDAISIARGKLRDARAALAREQAEHKAATNNVGACR